MDNLIALLDLEPGMAVLDLCCGVGRHSLEFARRGFQVTAVDRTERYLERASQQAAADGLEVEFVCEDMREFCRPGAFDVVLNLFTSFGIFEDQADDLRVVQNVRQSFRPDGRFLMEMMGKEVLARIYQERGWREEDGLLILEERKLSSDWSWIDARWILIKGTDRTEVNVSLRLYSAAELMSVLREGGFQDCQVFGDLKGSAYDQAARRMVVVASR